MSRKRKRRPLPPRTLRMNRAARLQSARGWLWLQCGRPAARIARSYRKRYGVDWECAIAELTALGVALDPAWRAPIARTLENARWKNARRRAERRRVETGVERLVESDETFAYIAGYTDWGHPYGVTWEEWRKLYPDSSMDPRLGESTIERTSKEAWPF